MPIAADYPFLDILWTMILFFAWVAWIWILITVLTDVFRRDDVSGWGKAGWTVFLIVLPFLGVLIYLGTQGKQMAERNAKDIQARQGEFDNYVREVAGGGGSAGEIAQARELLEAGAIDQAEFDRLKQKALA